MSTDFSQPQLGTNYSLLIPGVKVTIGDLACQLEPTLTGTHTNVPTGAVRWVASNSNWERWNGTTWTALAASYGISITGTAANVTGVVAVANGGTGANSAAGAPFAVKGANNDITSITGLTTALSVAQGGTGGNTAALARAALGVAPTDNPTFTGGIKETRSVVAASVLDPTAGSVLTKTITAITTFTVANVSAAGTVCSFLLELTNGGAFAVTWFANVRWAGGTQPTLTTTGKDVLAFYTHDGGANWTGLMVGKDVK